ncbi:ATP-binding protein [Streptomyces sp. ISL-96]|uniref:ATP-binding protein n=1 Tax=Streptomyces sp. ISL-96 TaxID=2819191 RepID=UPI001BED08A3|nr:ATP-binding protein [Streptomyces sp. ISL-96]MBT2492681.1 ATP-binding protein [Streptomyces sp. ISL-96]
MNRTQTTCSRRRGLAERTTRPDTAAEARDTAREFLCDLAPAPTPETTENVVLVVSELVTNALRHAGGITKMRLVAGRNTVQITVQDPSPSRPRPRHPDITGYEGGYGLTLVSFLSRFVTVSPSPEGGKAICAAVSR